MSSANGPKLAGLGHPGDNNLRLALDAGFHGSFAGEAASNRLNSPDANGRFTTGNTWSTYGTNQYNGNAYFDIGTISSVSSNQVTMSSWAHTLYTFDCLRPQVSQGGVYAGNNYFIFFIGGTSSNDSNTFEIYSFNASQNGSQGYINSATGYPAVYDGILGNGRTVGGTTGSAGSSIMTLTGTPTDMWWGPPHTPNVALVKEVVPDGGRIKGTPCLRIHKPRYWRAFAGDGWAYGAYPNGITQGDVIRLSFWHRPSPYGFGGENCTGGSWQTHFAGGAGSGGGYTFSPTVGDWRYVTYTWTASVSYNFIFYYFPTGGTYQYSIDVADMMYTINDGGAVPWCNSRSTSNSGASITGGWADLSGNDQSGDFSADMGPDDLYHLQDDSLTRLMVNTDGSAATNATIGTASRDPMFINFDGLADYLDLGSDILFKSGGGWTVESWVKPDAVSSGPYNFIGSASINYNSWYWSVLNSRLAMWDLSPGSVWKYGNTYLSTGQWYHAVLVSDPDNTSYYIYLNGEDDMSSGWSSYNGSWQSSKSSLAVRYVGRGSAANARYWNGQMSSVQFYNKALTAAEVKQNFNAQRSKFKV